MSRTSRSDVGQHRGKEKKRDTGRVEWAVKNKRGKQGERRGQSE